MPRRNAWVPTCSVLRSFYECWMRQNIWNSDRRFNTQKILNTKRKGAFKCTRCRSVCDSTHHISLSRVLPWSNENVVPGQRHQKNQRDHIELKIPHNHNEKLQKERTKWMNKQKERTSFWRCIYKIHKNTSTIIWLGSKLCQFFKNRNLKAQKDQHLWFIVPFYIFFGKLLENAISLISKFNFFISKFVFYWIPSEHLTTSNT